MSTTNQPEPLPTRILRLSPEDNIGVVTADVTEGERLMLDEHDVTVLDRIPMGHKLALVPIAKGEKVVKWGLSIGSATRAICPGEAVHTHNMKSDYLPTYTLDGTNSYLKEK